MDPHHGISPLGTLQVAKQVYNSGTVYTKKVGYDFFFEKYVVHPPLYVFVHAFLSDLI